MKTYAFLRALLSVAVLSVAPVNLWAQEGAAKKPLIIPWNHDQLIRDAQAKDAIILKDARAVTADGVRLVKLNNINGALIAFKKADDLYKKTKYCSDYNTQELVPPALVKAGRGQEAIAAYRVLFNKQLKAGETSSGFSSADGRSLMEFALLLYQSGQYEEAYTAYEKGLPAVNQGVAPYGPTLDEHFEHGNANPKRFLAAVYVGLALTAKNDPFMSPPEEGKVAPATEAAYTYYQSALKLHPTYALAHYYLAETIKARNYELGRTGPAVWQESKDEYKKAAQYGRGKVKAEAEYYAR